MTYITYNYVNTVYVFFLFYIFFFQPVTMKPDVVALFGASPMFRAVTLILIAFHNDGGMTNSARVKPQALKPDNSTSSRFATAAFRAVCQS